MPAACSWNCGVSGATYISYSVFQQYSHRCNNASVRIKQSNLHYAANAFARVHLYIVPLPARVCPQPFETQELIIWSCELRFYMNFLLIEFIIARISNYNIARMIPPSSPRLHTLKEYTVCGQPNITLPPSTYIHTHKYISTYNINATAYCCYIGRYTWFLYSFVIIMDIY